MRAGLRGRLLLAFLGITAFAVLGAVAGIWAMLRVGDSLDTITRQRVPAAVASLQLAVQAERIMAATPALLAVRDRAELVRRAEPLEREVAALEALVGTLRGAAIPQAILADLAERTGSFRGNLEALRRHVDARLELAAHKAAQLRRLATVSLNIQRVLRPGLKLLDVRRAQLEAATARGSGGDIVALAREIVALMPQQQAQAEALAINDGLLRVATVDRATAIEVLALPLQRSAATLGELVGGLAPALRTSLVAQVAVLRPLVEGEGGIPATRRAELASLADALRLLEENRLLSDGLAQAVARAVADGSAEIARADAEADAARRLGAGTLLGVVALSLVCSGLIVWLYVDGNLLRRLTALSDSMLAIAGGNLRTAIPVGGDDEIARMAKALEVFRETAVEVEDKNLRAVAEARQRLVDAIESISEGFALYDADDRLVLCNSRYREMMHVGDRDAALAGMTFAATIRDAASSGMVLEARGREAAWIEQRIARHRAPGGPFVQHYADGSAVRISERRIANGGTVAVYSDITELTRRAAELEEARDRADAATRAKSEFLAVMSHEIRTPMNAVIGMSRLLTGTALDAEQRDFVQTIDMAAEALLTVINDILDFSKIEAGRLDLDPHPAELRRCVEGTVAMVAARAAEKGLELVCRIDPDVPLAVEVDAARLRQILLNLLNNAVKFTERGEIRLSVARAGDGDRLRFAVSDTGIGIPADRMDRLFRSFSQVDASTTRRYGGTGLGLAISKRLSELMGGEIGVESEPGVGTTFAFTIPARPCALPDAARTVLAAAAGTAEAPPGPPLAILLVDDNRTNQKLGSKILQRLGHAADLAGDGREAVQACLGRAYDIVLMDIEMPDMDGIEATLQIRSRPGGDGGPFIVALTANAMAGDRERYLRAGMDDYISKPIRVEELVRCLDEARARRQKAVA